MMADMRVQSDEAAIDLSVNWPRSPISQSDDDTAIGLAVDTTVFRLIELPTEIVTNIFESLVPNPLPTGTRLPLPTDILASRAAMFNLCLTSKFCHETALPLMYRNIIITDRIQMAKLFINLMAHQDRCPWMRGLAFVGGLTSLAFPDPDDRSVLARSKASVETFEIRHRTRALEMAVDDLTCKMSQTHNELQNPSDSSMLIIHFEWQFRNIYNRLFQIVLYLGTRIEDLLVTRPLPLFAQNDSDTRESARQELDAMTSGRLPPARAHDEAMFGATLRALRRVRVQPDPKKAAGLNPLPLGPEFLKCQSWELLGDNGFWWSLLPETPRVNAPLPARPLRYLGILSHVTELRLYDSRTHPAWLQVLLRHARSLEVLCYTTDATEWNVRFLSIAPGLTHTGATLQQAINEVMDTLTELQIGWVPWGANLTADEEAAVAPHRVYVSNFPRLKKVDIDLPFAYHDGSESISDNDDDGTE